MPKRKPFVKLVENKLPRKASSPSSSLSSRSSRNSTGSRGSRVVPLLDDRDCDFLSDIKKANDSTSTHIQRVEPTHNTTAVRLSKPVPFTSQTKTPKVSNVTVQGPAPPSSRIEANKTAATKVKQAARTYPTRGENTEDESVYSDTSRTSRSRQGKRRRRQTISALPRPPDRYDDPHDGSIKRPTKPKHQVTKNERTSLTVPPSLQTIAEEGEEVSSPEQKQTAAGPRQQQPATAANDLLAESKTATPVLRNQNHGNPNSIVLAQNSVAVDTLLRQHHYDNDDMDLSSDEESLISPGEAVARQVLVVNNFGKNSKVLYKTPMECKQVMDSKQLASDPSRNTNPAASQRPIVAQSFPAGCKNQRENLRQICLFTPSQLVEGFQTPMASDSSPKSSSSGKVGMTENKESVLASLKPPSTPSHGKPFSEEDLLKCRTTRPDNAAVMQALLAESKEKPIDRGEDTCSGKKSHEPVSIKTVIISAMKKGLSNPYKAKEEDKDEEDATSELTLETNTENDVEAPPCAPVPPRHKFPPPHGNSQLDRGRPQMTKMKAKPRVSSGSPKVTDEVIPRTEPRISPRDSSNLYAQTDAAIKGLQSGAYPVRTKSCGSPIHGRNTIEREFRRMVELSNASTEKESTKPEKTKRGAKERTISSQHTESHLAKLVEDSVFISGKSKIHSQNKDEKSSSGKYSLENHGMSPAKQDHGPSSKIKNKEDSTSEDSQGGNESNDVRRESLRESPCLSQIECLGETVQHEAPQPRKSPNDVSQRHTSTEQQEDFDYESAVKEGGEDHSGSEYFISAEQKCRNRESSGTSPFPENRTVQSNYSVLAPMEGRVGSASSIKDKVQLLESHAGHYKLEGLEDDELSQGSTFAHPLRYLERHTYTAERAGFKQIAPFIRFPSGQTFLHPPLPPGWQVSVCTRSEKVYYWHPDFGRTYFPPIPLPSADGKIHGTTPRYIVHCEGTIPPPSGFDLDLDIGYDYDDSEHRQNALSNSSSIAETCASMTSHSSRQEQSEVETPSSIEQVLDSETGLRSGCSSQRSPCKCNGDSISDKSEYSPVLTPHPDENVPNPDTRNDMWEDDAREQNGPRKDYEENDAGEKDEIVICQRENKNQSEIQLVPVHETSDTMAENKSPLDTGTPALDEENHPGQEIKGEEIGALHDEDLVCQHEEKDHSGSNDEAIHGGWSTSPSAWNVQSPLHGQFANETSPVAFDDSPKVNSGEQPSLPVQAAKEAGHVWPSYVSVPQSNVTPAGSEQESPENVSVLGDGGASTLHQECHRKSESQNYRERNTSVAGSIVSRISYRAMHPPMPVCCLQNIGSLEVYQSSSKKRTKEESGRKKKKRTKRGLHIRSQLVV